MREGDVKLKAVELLARTSVKHRLDPEAVMKRMKAPEAYDFASPPGVMEFAFDVGSAVQSTLQAEDPGLDGMRIPAKVGDVMESTLVARSNVRPWVASAVTPRPAASSSGGSPGSC
jgi:hypothetical protein